MNVQPRPGDEAASLSDRLHSALRSDILSLDLSPGAPLRLPALSDRYQVGLTPLRDCLMRLAAERLVENEHNKGFRVTALSAPDLIDLETSRSSVEGALFAEAVRAGDDAWEAAVIGSYHQLERTPAPTVAGAAERNALWTRRHRAFHDALVSAAPSHWMHRFRQTLSDHLGRYHIHILAMLRGLGEDDAILARSAEAIFARAMQPEPHRALYETALARDAARAREEVERHAQISVAAFRDLLAEVPLAAGATGAETRDRKGASR